MANKIDEQQPSETALFSALHRAIAHKEFKNEYLGPDYLAELFLPFHFKFFIKFKRVRARTKKNIGTAFPGLHEYVIARTAYFDRVFVDALNNKFPQIVLLGAGYDSRAYRFSKLNQGTNIIELDLEPTQNRKKECLEKGRINLPTQVSLVPINFNEESLENVLERAGYKNTEKTLFLWEGVSYYLEEDAVAITLDFVGPTSNGKSAIAFDYTTSISGDIIEQYGVK